MAASSKPKRNWTAEVTEGRVDALQSIFIAVMGVTGAGKSSFISLCSDEVVEVGHDLTAHTSEVDVFSFKYNEMTTVYLIDTPGFDDTNRSDTEVLQDLAAFLTRSYSNNIKLNGIIYLHRITDVRMQGSAKRNLMMFKKLCGKDALRNVILATTMWSNVTPEKGAERESQLLSTPEFWGWMKAQGSTVRRHIGDRRSAVRIIDYFVDQKSHVTLEIQDQMVNQNKDLDQTSAGQELQSELLREREKFKADLEQVQRDMQDAIKERDAMAEEALKEARAEYMSKIEELSKQGEDLKISMQKLHEANYKELRDRMIDQVESHRRKVSTAAGRREHAEQELGKVSLTSPSVSDVPRTPTIPPTSSPSPLPHQDPASSPLETPHCPQDQPKYETIKFKDAVGRKFSFPFHLCVQWQGMEELIKQCFLHVDVIGPHVQEGHYDLIGPNGEIILPQVWESLVEPGWSVTMHMWPLPEPKPPYIPHDQRPLGNRGHHASSRGPPPGPPPLAHRGGAGPPPPPLLGRPAPGARPPLPPPGRREGGLSNPPVMVVRPGSPPGRSKRKSEPPKGVLSWLVAGKSISKE